MIPTDPAPPPVPRTFGVAPGREDPAASPRRRLTLFDGVCVIVGIIVGAGFYESVPRVAAAVGSPAWVVAIWLAGGLVSLVGAMCYAELTAAWPREGSEYVFLTRAFGRPVGFLFAWAGFWVVRPGNTGAMAFVFAHYAQQVWPLPLSPNVAYLTWAAGAVVLLTVLNVLGVRTGKWTQNLLTAAKVIGLLVVFAAGLWSAAGRSVPAGPMATAAASPDGRDPMFGMILVLFAYGGWNEIAAVAAEVRRPERNLLRALLLGTVAVTAIYVVGNLVFVRSLGWAGVVGSKAVAADVLRPIWGAWGAAFISALVCVSSLGAVSGMIFTGSRVLYAVGSDYRPYAFLGRWSGALDAPARALLVQAVITLALVAGFGLYENGFERLVVFTGPLFWGFFLLAGIAVFVLRARAPDVPRPYRVSGYPVTPAVFALSSAFMLYASTAFAIKNRQWEGLWAAGAMAAGVIVMLAHGERVEDQEKGQRPVAHS